MFGAAGRPAEVLREGSGIRVGGKAGAGLAIITYIKDTGNVPSQEDVPACFIMETSRAMRSGSGRRL